MINTSIKTYENLIFDGFNIFKMDDLNISKLKNKIEIATARLARYSILSCP